MTILVGAGPRACPTPGQPQGVAPTDFSRTYRVLGKDEAMTHPTLSHLRQRARLAYLQPQRVNEAAVADKRDNPPSQVDDLRLGEIGAEFVK